MGARGDGDLFYIPVAVRSLLINQNNFFIIRFCVDTGASITSISDTDAIKKRINYTQCIINPYQIKIAGGGKLTTRIVSSPQLLFSTEENQPYFHRLNKLHIMDRNNSIDALLNPTISLLGIDFLENFTIKFKNNYVYLER